MVPLPYSEMSRNNTPGEATVLAAPFGVHDAKSQLPHVDYTPHKHMAAHANNDQSKTGPAH